MNYYRTSGLVMAILFTLVGFSFLLFSNDVLIFFNTIASHLGMKQSPVQGVDFYLVLAVGYMYLVSLLAYMMVKHPDNTYFPLLLSHAKFASSILSLSFFVLHEPYLIYLANCIVDGSIGILVISLYFKLKKILVRM